MTVVYGLWWTFVAVLVVVAVVFGVEATVFVAGAVMRVVGWLLGAAWGLLAHDA